MPTYTFQSVGVYDPVTDVVQENATGGKFVLNKDDAGLPIYDLNGSPIAQITSNKSGQSIPFKADYISGLVQFGDLVVAVFAVEVGAYAIEGHNAAAAAADAQVDAAAALTLAAGAARPDTAQVWTQLQNFQGGISVPDGSLTISDVQSLQAAIDAAAASGGSGLTNYSQVTSLTGYPAFIAAGSTAAAARSAINVAQGAREAVPWALMWWNNSTGTWWGWDPTTNAAVNGMARPAVPPGFCTYDAVLWPTATQPAGTQAAQGVANGIGDKLLLHKDSTLW